MLIYNPSDSRVATVVTVEATRGTVGVYESEAAFTASAAPLRTFEVYPKPCDYDTCMAAAEAVLSVSWDDLPAPVPQTVTPYQGKAALLQAGMLSDVEDIVATSTDPYLKLAWTNAIAWDRQSPMIASVAAAMGMTSQQVDDLFIAASQITA